jgi:hypothetical protein
MSTPGGLQVDGGKIAASGDAAAREGGLDAVAVDGLRQPDNVDEPAYGSAGKDERWKFQIWD